MKETHTIAPDNPVRANGGIVLVFFPFSQNNSQANDLIKFGKKKKKRDPITAQENKYGFENRLFCVLAGGGRLGMFVIK